LSVTNATQSDTTRSLFCRIEGRLYCNSVFASNQIGHKLQSVILQHVWLLGLRSMSVVCHGQCMMTCTGWLFLRGCSRSSPWRSIVVFSTGHYHLRLWSARRRHSTVCYTCLPQHVWKPFFFCRRTNSPELTAWWFAGSSYRLRQDLKHT